MSQDKSRYSDLLDVWPPPNEATRARLQRLQELEQQRQTSNPEQTRSSSLDRTSSSSRENLGGYRGLSRTSSFRTYGRRSGESSSALSSANSIRESRGLRRSNSAAARSTHLTSARARGKNDSDDTSLKQSDKSLESRVDQSQSEQVNAEKSEASPGSAETSKTAKSGSATGDIPQNTNVKKADTEIEISSGSSGTWKLSGEGEKRLEQISGLDKLKELEEMRLRSRSTHEQTDSNLSVRERFNLNATQIARPTRQLSVQQQIRNSRRARRHSDLQLSSTSTFGTENASSESTAQLNDTPSVHRSERSRVVNTDSWDKALDDTSERLKRLDQLKILREKGRNAIADMDPNILTSSESLVPTYDTSSNRIFPLSSSGRSGSVPSLASSGRSYEYASHFPSIAEQSEQQSFMSTPAITSHMLSSELSISTDTTSIFGHRAMELELAQEYTNTVAVPLSVDRTGSVPSTTSRFNDFVRRTESTGILTRQSSAPVLRSTYESSAPVTRTTFETPHAARLKKKHQGLPEELQDLYLAECFDPKYTLKERVVLIRKKLWGDPPNFKSNERGKPDGASQSENTGADNENSSTEVTTATAVSGNSENTKSI